MRTPGAEDESPADAAPAAGSRQRFWLRFSDHDVELAQGETLIGRSERCQIVVDDPLVSRRHAVFIVERDGVSIQDLGSVNGVLVNGTRLRGTQKLDSGDRIGLGRQEIEMYSAEASSRARSPTDRKRLAARTLSGLASQDGDAEATRQGNALDMLGGVADKVLALGRGKEAERILKKPLEGVIHKVRRGATIEPELAERAAGFAVRLAEATGQAMWIDYAFELYLTRRAVLPAAVVDSLYSAIRKVPGVSLPLLRDYLDVLRSLEDKLGPAERFLARRLEGLEGLAGAG